MGDYHDLFLKTDVLLLAVVFENFVNTCLEDYGLDLCHYFSSPRLTSNAVLKMTGIELELISGIKMYLFIEKGMRAGISYITKRYVKQVINTCNHMMLMNELNTFYTLIDANNLYGWALIQCLSYGRF